VSHDFQDVNALLEYPDHCSKTEIVAADIEDELLISYMVRAFEGFLNVRIVLPLSGPRFGYPVIERSFSVCVLGNELFDSSSIQYFQLPLLLYRHPLKLRGILQCESLNLREVDKLWRVILCSRRSRYCKKKKASRVWTRSQSAFQIRFLRFSCA